MKPARLLFALCALLIVGYGLFEGWRLFAGPHITITSPISGSATSSPLVTIVGSVQNISFLTINDAPVYTNEHGVFSYRLSPPPGYAVLMVRAKDRFGRGVEKQLEVTVLNYCPIIS